MTITSPQLTNMARNASTTPPWKDKPDETVDMIVDDLEKVLQGIRDHAERSLQSFEHALGRAGVNFEPTDVLDGLDDIISDVLGECRNQVEQNSSELEW